MEAVDREKGGAACGRCAYFRGDGAALEAAFPGYTAMGSGFASVRARDGLCGRHEVVVSARDVCPDFLHGKVPGTGGIAPHGFEP